MPRSDLMHGCLARQVGLLTEHPPCRPRWPNQIVPDVFVGLVTVAMPNIKAPGVMPPVQILKSDVAMIEGAALGAMTGIRRRQRPKTRFARVAQDTDAIVPDVATRGTKELCLLAHLVAAQGGSNLYVA